MYATCRLLVHSRPLSTAGYAMALLRSRSIPRAGVAAALKYHMGPVWNGHSNASDASGPAIVQCWNCEFQNSCHKPGHAHPNAKTHDECLASVVGDITLQPNYFCHQCGKVQDIENLDYFDLLGVERSFDLDVSEVKKQYRVAQSQLHPDKFSLATDMEKDISAKQAANINQAYRCLCSPLDRAHYLFRLVAPHMADPLGEDSQLGASPELLMEIMEIRESIVEADESLLKELGAENVKKMDEITRAMSGCFEKQDYDGVARLLVKLKYYNTIDDEIKKLSD